ncbi:MAG: histidine kinase [Bacteroidetes bacterium HGW-Bacteroidetes-16]|nr:MAG: histidine kinase [Bacteroidetes bacterium HGW-Bacteroidetes-16]
MKKNDFVNYNEASSWEKLKNSITSWRYIGVGKSLLLWFLAISLVPLVMLSYINYLVAYQGLTIVGDKSLSSTSQLRLKYINTYFISTVDLLEITSSSPSNLQFFQELENKYTQSGMPAAEFVKTSQFLDIASELRDEFEKPLEENDIYNFLFIDRSGNVLFSVKSESILGKNLYEDKLGNSLLSQTARKSFETGNILFSDIEVFKPSYQTISGFFTMPVKTAQGEKIGIIALQITMDGINRMIQQEAGYGETGQAYLIGKDFYLRSTTRFGDESEILNKKVENDKTRSWKDYLLHRDDINYLKNKELDEEKVSNYNSDNRGKYVIGIYRNIDMLEPYGVNWALVEEIEHAESFANARKLSDIAKISLIITILVVLLIALLVTRWFVNPIKQLSSWGKEVAIGKLDSKSIKAPKNEVGEMRNTFNRLVTSLNSYANVARLMAKGDYSEKVETRSPEDVLGHSINQMIESLRSVVDQAHQIAKGDYSAVITPRSENDTLGKALFKMTETLRENAIEMQRENWLKTGINNLDSRLKGHQSMESLTQSMISFFCEYLDAQIGLCYLLERNQLKLSSSYAIKDVDKIKVLTFNPGEGIVGQVFLERKRLVISDQQYDNTPVFNFGVGETIPRYLVIVPFSRNDETVGVMQLGMINKPSEDQLRFIDTAINDTTLAIVTLQSHLRVLELLTRTQEQAHELEVQQEELRQANEELQEQTNALKVSEEHLQEQQEELRVTNEELEERTRALEIQRDAIKIKNKELENARKDIELKAHDLELASTYKSEFLANMSHELRTPLNSIIVLSQLMAENRKKHLDDKELQFSQTIHSSGNDLLNLINDILDLSKVESGKIEVNLERCYLNDLKVFVADSFEELMNAKGLKLGLQLDENLPEYITSDVQRIQQIVKNLFSNAIKFTEKGEIRLIISKPADSVQFSNPILKPDNSIAISVQDTGIGIPAEKQELIFEAFKQADGTTSRRYGGTGLGLSISKNFAKLLGGEMQLSSKDGEGSTFTLYLPFELVLSEHNPDVEINIKEENSSEMENNTPEEPENDQPDITPQNQQVNDDRNTLFDKDRVILIIEDDENFASVLLTLAHDHKFKALIALDGETGLYLADYHRPSAIILDIGLPGMDGYQVMKKLKINPKTRHIPVHFISASDRNINALKMGAIGFLTKPVAKEAIDAVFNKIEVLISKPVKRLLVVEDEEIMRVSIINLMKGDNIDIIDVPTGKDAIEHLKKESFDCMILDLGLVDMTGFDLLDIITEQQIAPNLPIVIYTGRELTKDENDLLLSHSQTIILKGAHSFERLLAETTLFLHQVESKLPQKKKEMIESFHGKDNVLEGKTILVVDDDMRNVFAITSLLESYQAKVVIGKNGREGIEKLKSTPNVDLILMDIMMPEMDGYEAMRAIRKEKEYKKLPIIALTAKAMKEDRDKCLAAGANEYLSKPVEKDKLISLLRVWLY